MKLKKIEHGLDTTKCKRTGCVFCGFGCHLEKEPNRFQRLQVTHPALYNYCMKPWENGGLGMKELRKLKRLLKKNSTKGYTPTF